MRSSIFALLFTLPAMLLAKPPARVRLGVGESTVLEVPGLVRAAIGTSKVAKLVSVPPKELLLTGIAPGTTTVRYWAGRDNGVTTVTVVANERSPGEATPSVVRALLEFVEVDRTVADSMGIQWPDALHFRAGASLSANGVGSGVDFAAPFATTQGMISLMARRGWARVLSRPEMLVRLGEEAKFHSGGEVPVLNTVATQAGYSQSVEWKTYGLTVRVQPESSDGMRFLSTVSVDLSELQPSSSGPVPSLNRRTLSTKMDSVDGETVLLSGLFREVTVRERQGLPGLSEIPLLKYLFSREVERRDTTELFLAMTLTRSTTLSRERDVEGWTARAAEAP